MTPATLRPGDALVVVDVQNDFVTGALRVPDAAAIIPVMNRYIRDFRRRGLPIVATRDWHPADHVSFRERCGPWPAHCVAGTLGAAFAAGLELPADTLLVSKATQSSADAYSGFERTDMDRLLRARGIGRLFVGGLATDYCVLGTVRDALRLGYGVCLLADAIRAVNLRPGDGAAAERKMAQAGAMLMRLADVVPEATVDE
jgi:nicotinamidase/pyrazinamidase